MRSLRSQGRLLALAVVATVGIVLLEASCRTAPVRLMPTARAPLLAEWVPPPVVRVGLVVDGERATVSAAGGILAWEQVGAGPLRPVEGAAGVANLVGTSPVSVDATALWRVQLASLEQEGAAEDLVGRVRRATGLPALKRWNAGTGTFQVRVGGWGSREEAEGAKGRLSRSGFDGGWVAEDERGGRSRVRLLETGKDYEAVLIAPRQTHDVLVLGSTAYRGLLEVRGGAGGGLTVVNVVNLEEYLRGVVPNELAPEAYPYIEALKAQAVAARTYALRNRGQFASKGFDICATSACQVYRGASSEQPLSDQAVEATRGVVATYHGRLIRAMYTSTCGGHTEDVENVFEGPSVPYLRGVPCTAERSSWRRILSTAEGVPVPDKGCSAQDVALLSALGVLEPEDLTLKDAPSDAQLRILIRRLVGALGRPACAAGVEEPLTRRGAFFSALVGRMCWEERGRRLLQGTDVDYLLQLEDRDGLALDRDRLAAALLIHEELLAPFGDNTLRPNAPVTRGQALAVLARTALRAGAPTLLSGRFVDYADGRMVVDVAGQRRSLDLDSTAQLFRTVDGRTANTHEVLLVPGDRLRVVALAEKIVFLEAVQDRMGAAADRGSRHFRWEASLTPDEVARGVARYGDAGVVRDLKPLRLGVSGRVAELAVLGSGGEVTLRGMSIRSALGLRENLFVIDREIGPGGAVRRFIFSGKGWGHGVGLCQVGAASLAQAGADYQTILKHYYTGIQVEHRP